MAIIKEDNGLISGGAINPTLSDHYTGTRVSGTMKTFTVDTSKSYVLTMTYRYNDSSAVYRTNVYSLVNGTLTDLTNTSESTGLTASISGTTLTVTGSGVASVMCDITLVQLD